MTALSLSLSLSLSLFDSHSDGDQPNNVRVARQCLANMFYSSAGCQLMVNYQQQVSIKCLKRM